MKWEKLKYNKSEINQAGKTLTKDNLSEGDRDKALDVLDNWRAVHSYPMNIFKKRLKKVSEKLDNKSITAQRLKRVPAIIYKLKRGYNGHSPSMKLYQMQDIGGCRAVLSNVDLARKLYCDSYINGELKHELVTKKDYINSPKDDGYRSFHLVYKFKSDKEKKEFNGLLIEIQIRSKLQHLWATAVETVDLFTRQAIKSNEGEKEWIEFFKLVSSGFAIMEGSTLVPNTPSDRKELYIKIKEKAKELDVIKIMNGWNKALEVAINSTKSKPKLKFFLLDLDIKGEKLTVFAYTKEQEKIAIDDYARVEKKNAERKEYDVVLVGAESIKELKKAYPNYFVDTKEFLSHLEKMINKAD